MSAMLLPHPSFSTSRSKEIIDARSQVQALFAVSVGSREEVGNGPASSGAEPVAVQDLGSIRARGLEDPDGHVRESLYTDPAAAEAGPPRE
ncbi:hypothetical protein [Rathayibacter sp. AY1A2]|uniref:hypothetical protein n=1 Tax=Rathayibacter sp. AY1A2 TaxID=2080520 RepID=UPI0011B05B4E|nr:hypothetical protein [Rathayibacter sp. AY1A2]